MYSRYEITVAGETFVLTRSTNDISEYDIFILTEKGLSQSKKDYTNNTQNIINEIFNNLDKYTTSANKIHPNYRYE